MLPSGLCLPSPFRSSPTHSVIQSLNIYEHWLCAWLCAGDLAGHREKSGCHAGPSVTISKHSTRVTSRYRLAGIFVSHSRPVLAVCVLRLSLGNAPSCREKLVSLLGNQNVMGQNSVKIPSRTIFFPKTEWNSFQQGTGMGPGLLLGSTMATALVGKVAYWVNLLFVGMWNCWKQCQRWKETNG